jgi:hypothetical protein
MGNSAPAARISPHQPIPPGGRIPEGYYIKNGIIRLVSEKGKDGQKSSDQVMEVFTAKTTPTSASLPGRQRDDTGVIEDIDDK